MNDEHDKIPEQAVMTRETALILAFLARITDTLQYMYLYPNSSHEDKKAFMDEVGETQQELVNQIVGKDIFEQ